MRWRGAFGCRSDILEADFASTISGIAPYFDINHEEVNPFSTTFTAEFFFNTPLSTVQETAPGTYQLTCCVGPPGTPTGFPSASITLAAIGGHPSYGNGPVTFSVSGYVGGTLIWQEGIGPTMANVGSEFHHLSMQLPGRRRSRGVRS